VRKKRQVDGVTSEWVCKYSRARYIMKVTGDVCEELFTGEEFPPSLIRLS
jgi:hypothetical protein